MGILIQIRSSWRTWVKKQLEAEVTRIEAAQQALRESIAQTKVLAEDAEKMLRRNKTNLTPETPRG